MTDLPSGEWSELLVGHQWPASTAVLTLNLAASQRASNEAAFESYATILASIRLNQLALQEGSTAESSRALFLSGIEEARFLADKIQTKKTAYEAVSRSVESLRDALAALAESGNAAIGEVQKSQQPIGVKVSEIVHIISEVNSEADSKAALCASHVYSSIQSILSAEGIDSSAGAFAESQGLQTPQFNQSVSPASLAEHVSAKLDGANSGADKSPSVSNPIGNVGTLDSIASGNRSTAKPTAPDLLTQAVAVADTSPGGPSGVGLSSSGFRPAFESQEIPPPAQAEPTASAASPAAEGGSLPTIGTQTAANSINPHLDAVGTNSQSNSSFPSSIITAPDSTVRTNQTEVTDSQLKVESIVSGTVPPTTKTAPDFNENAEMIRPSSHAVAAAEVMTTTTTTPGHSIAAAFNPHLLDSVGPMGPSVDDTHAVATPSEVPPLALTEVAQPVINSVAPAITTTTATTPAFAAGPPINPLIAYGTDLKPAVSLPPVPPMAPAAPTSAPVTPASGTAPTGQPAVVRQQDPGAAAARTSATGFTERAFAATATGAAAASAASRSAAENRLHRLLEAVARQQPRLRWAIGDLEDGSTVLVTDISNGWIPPHIDIPTGVRLLPPRDRRNGLTSLLGATVLTAIYQPGQFLSASAQPTPMSIRARDTTPIEDLGWELTQATKWRDGLPRLAHTLARAASSKTGYLDSELDLLHEHLNIIERSVLDSYPDTVDSEHIGNWQLLATIDALINGETTSANYHFAWFRAQALTREGPR